MATDVLTYLLMKIRMNKSLTEAEKKILFEELWNEHFNKAYNFAYNMTLKNREEAEDLIKETSLRAWKFFDKYDAEKPFDNWLLTIMRRVQIDRVRRRPAYIERSMDDDPYGSGAERYNIADENQEPVDVRVAKKDYNEKVMDVVYDLPDKFREAVLLADAEGKSYGEIAEITGANVGTVRSRIFRGRKMLIDRLRKAGLVPEEYLK